MHWLVINLDELKRVDYIIELTKPFALCTSMIGQTKGPTIYMVFSFYNTLLDNLELVIAKLQRKGERFTRPLYNAV